MSLPIVVIFERHWDTVPKNLLNELLPELSKKGYQTYCFEAAQNLSSTQIIDQYNLRLESDLCLEQRVHQFLNFHQVEIIGKLSEMSFGTLAE